MNRIIYSILILTVILISGCSKRPPLVVDDDKMIDVMVDIHKSEAMLTSSPGTFINDSMKKVLRQSILLKHSMTQEELDSSLSWYGKNIDKYAELYDEVIKRLENQLSSSEKKARDDGESMAQYLSENNLWEYSPLQYLSYNSNTDKISFSKDCSGLLDKGDIINWEVRIKNSNCILFMFLAADYDNKTTAFTSKSITNDGKQSISLQTDSMHTVKRLFGYIRAVPKNKEIIFIDSIQLSNLPMNKGTYSKINSQHKFSTENEQRCLHDSININN